MMKKIIFILCAALPLLLKAQFTVNVQLPPAGMIQKESLWNIVLVNNSSEMTDVSLSLNLQDAVTGQLVLAAVTRNFTTGKGIKVINYRDVQPVLFNYLASELSGNFIPLGSYIACYRVFKKEKANEALADECVRININPLSPPLLNTPPDKSVLQTTYPQFSWIPPAPTEMFSNLSYDISVVEVMEGQSATQAIFNNIPVYANSNIRNVFENLPSSYSSLEPGKNYAWQVIAKNGFNYSGQTEVWTFTLGPPDSTKVKVTTSAYILLNDNSDNAAVNYINDKNLFIKYYSYSKEYEATVKVKDADGKVMQELSQKISYGDNFLLFKLNRHFEEGKVYTLEITDLQGKSHSVPFSIRKTNSSN
ncbi:MAG: hypothetical protein E6H07_12810 [Bacteroidetes bacterium]|nr:MAG: hypothetical protein E6H07_12810 [Bacteroidota bacterium]